MESNRAILSPIALMASAKAARALAYSPFARASAMSGASRFRRRPLLFSGSSYRALPESVQRVVEVPE